MDPGDGRLSTGRLELLLFSYSAILTCTIPSHLCVLTGNGWESSSDVCVKRVRGESICLTLIDLVSVLSWWTGH